MTTKEKKAKIKEGSRQEAIVRKRLKKLLPNAYSLITVMSSNLNKHNTSTTAPINIDDGNKESEPNSSLTVELSSSSTLAVSSKKSSVLTTESITSNVITTAPANPAASILSDATVIRSRNDLQDQVNSNSPKVGSFTKESSNANVKIIQDDLFNVQDESRVQLGDYQIIESIGGGGMGRIYRAWDTRLDRDVALKVLAPNQQSDEARERFVIEAKASAKLHHDNIVSVYAFGQTDDVMYLVMEFIPGSNIRDMVTKNGPLSIEDTLSYAIQLSSALEHINENGIVHRDIKPSNVLITDDGTVKVIDLGLAKNFMEPSNDLTQTGVTLGTFDYISPEQARDPRNVDIRSDIYSLGCSLFFMLTGQPPFPNRNPLQKLLSHQGDEAPSIQSIRPDAPDRLVDIIMRCMAKNREMRYQTPQELSKALFMVAEEQGMRPSGLSMSKWYLPSISRLRLWKDRLWWAIPIVALIIAILILDNVWKPNLRQSEFLPEKPGLKRNSASINSDSGFKTDNLSPGSKVKPLNFNIHPKAFPPSSSITLPEDSIFKQSDNAMELAPSAQNSAPSDELPDLEPIADSLNDLPSVLDSDAPTAELQEPFIPDVNNALDANKPDPGKAPKGTATPRKTVHSVTLEND